MDVTDKEIRELQDAFAIDTGEEISAHEAREIFDRLVPLYERIGRRLPVERDTTYESM